MSTCSVSSRTTKHRRAGRSKQADATVRPSPTERPAAAGSLRCQPGAQAPLAVRSRHSIADSPAARDSARFRHKSGPHRKKTPGLYLGHAAGLMVGLLEWPRDGGYRPRQTP
jgi:hypothetical protein